MHTFLIAAMFVFFTSTAWSEAKSLDSNSMKGASYLTEEQRQDIDRYRLLIEYDCDRYYYAAFKISRDVSEYGGSLENATKYGEWELVTYLREKYRPAVSELADLAAIISTFCKD